MGLFSILSRGQLEYQEMGQWNNSVGKVLSTKPDKLIVGTHLVADENSHKLSFTVAHVCPNTL